MEDIKQELSKTRRKAKAILRLVKMKHKQPMEEAKKLRKTSMIDFTILMTTSLMTEIWKTTLMVVLKVHLAMMTPS
jgi:hypothetical protein